MANNVAEKLVKLLLLIPMVGVLALLVRGQLGLSIDPRRWLGFVLGIVNAVARFLVIAAMDPYFLRPDDRAIVDIFARAQGVEYRQSPDPITVLVVTIMVLFVLDGIYIVSQEASCGQTLGKRAVGTKVVMMDGGRVSVRAALVRYVFLFFAFVGLGGIDGEAGHPGVEVTGEEQEGRSHALAP